MSNGEVVNKKAINYTNLWPIALAPVIPAVGIALRYAPEPGSQGVVVVVVSQLKKTDPTCRIRRPYPQYRWPVIGAIGTAILLGAHNAVVATGISTK